AEGVRRAYVANECTNAVTVIDTATNSVIATIPIGTIPASVAITPDGTRAYVTLPIPGINAIAVIDTATNTVIATIPVGFEPQNIAIAPDGARAYVPNI